MDPFNKKRISELTQKVIERDEMAEFERQFRDPQNPSKLKPGLKIEEIFEAAGFAPTPWTDIDSEDRKWILEKRYRQEAYGVSQRPWENPVFASADKKTFYIVNKVGRDFAWSRFSITKGNRVIEPLNHDSSLSEVISIVAYHECGEKPTKVKSYHSLGEAIDVDNWGKSQESLQGGKRDQIGTTLKHPREEKK